MVPKRSSVKRNSEDDEYRPRKRAKTTGHSEQVCEGVYSKGPQKRRRVAGSLSLIMTMPIEVFAEIASNLSPEYLLRMARASKALRTFLMSKSSKPIWTAAEQVVGMPACPPDLSCPQYASLIFDKFCMNCLATRASDVVVQTRSRLCKKCEETELISGRGLLPEGMDSVDLSALIPGSGLFRLATRKHWLKFYLKDSGDLFREMQFHYKPLVLIACQEYTTMSEDKETRRAALLERSELMYKLRNHAMSLLDWITCQYKAKEKAIQGAKQRRHKEVIRRLYNLGYTARDCTPSTGEKGLKWKALIDQPRELTERAWATIRPQLEMTIRRRKESRRRYARKLCLSERRKQLRVIAKSVFKYDKEIFYLLSYTELLDIPDIKKIINASGSDTRIMVYNIDVIIKIITEHGAKAKREATERCKSDMKEALAECGLLPSRPNGKTNKRRKSKSSTPMSPVNVLEHKCAFFRNLDEQDSNPRSFEGMLEADSSKVLRSYDVFTNTTMPEVYGHNSGLPDAQAMMIANSLVDLLNIGELTMKELDTLGKTFVCLRCGPLLRQKMTWQELVAHYFREEQDWQKATSSDLWETEMHKMYVNDHCLEDDSLGDVAIDISKITEDMKSENLIKLCNCETCVLHPIWWGRRQCRVCDLVGVNACVPCVRKMHRHLQTKHGPSSEKELRKELGMTRLWKLA